MQASGYFDKIIGVMSTAAEIGAAIIAAAGAITVSVFTYTFQLDANRKQNLLLAKQANYQQVLRNAGEWIRNRDDKHSHDAVDALYNAHSQTWVFGDNDVVKCTVEFMKEPNRDNYIKLLSAMRGSMGLPEIDDDTKGKVEFYIPTKIKKTVTKQSEIEEPVNGLLTYI